MDSSSASFFSVLFATSLNLLATPQASTKIDLSKATVVVRPGTLPAAEQTAARVLVEEVRKRTGLSWSISTSWPARGNIIALSSGGDPGWPQPMPRREGTDLPEHRAEGFRLAVAAGGKQRGVVWIHGADSRGALFGVGQTFVKKMLRQHRETGDLAPGASKTITLNLTPGHYALICNMPGHYLAGQRTDLTVK